MLVYNQNQYCGNNHNVMHVEASNWYWLYTKISKSETHLKADKCRECCYVNTVHNVISSISHNIIMMMDDAPPKSQAVH